jgi:orotidine-5'-phosphate decarboxylase
MILKTTVMAAALLAVATPPAVAQPQTRAESAGCFISETAYYRQRILHDLKIDQIDQSNSLYVNMMNAVAEAVAQKCSVNQSQGRQAMTQ